MLEGVRGATIAEQGQGEGKYAAIDRGSVRWTGAGGKSHPFGGGLDRQRDFYCWWAECSVARLKSTFIHGWACGKAGSAKPFCLIEEQ